MSGFDKLEPRQKKQIIWAVIGIILFTLIMVGYNLRSKRSLNLTGDQSAKSVALEPDLIQKTTLRETRRELEKLKNELNALKKDQEMAERKNQGLEKTVIPSADEISKTPTPSSQNSSRMASANHRERSGPETPDYPTTCSDQP